MQGTGLLSSMYASHPLRTGYSHDLVARADRFLFVHHRATAVAVSVLEIGHATLV